jgi:ABC-2 type transport system ATP-binding protein
MISVEGLTRRYGDFLAINNVSFQIDQGEIVGLLGHNGAGKTTLMKILTGYLEADAGVVNIDGLDIDKSRKAIQQKMGYLPENCPVYPEMTVIDYLRYAARLHGLNAKDVDGAVYRAIELTGLFDKATAVIATLSRGLRQRAGVAQAILHQPQILILDEPTNGLDPSQIHHMRDLIKTLAEQATVIVSTHILQEVQAVCDRVIIMRRGCKALDARMEDLRQVNRLLIEVDASQDEFSSVVRQIENISHWALVDSGQNFYRYALSISHDAPIKTVSSHIAHIVQQQGFALYALQPELRDLETVFGELEAGC